MNKKNKILYSYTDETAFASDSKLLLHKLLTNYKRCDHKDLNIFNNRKSNLRESNLSENARNRNKTKLNSSGFKGVCWINNRKKWQSQIGINYKKIFLGYFDNKYDAARAYNRAALKYHGEFARLNQLY